MNDLFWCLLKGLKAGDKHIGDHEKPIAALMVLIVSSKNAGSNNLAHACSSDVDGGVVGLVGLLSQELHPVDQQTVND